MPDAAPVTSATLFSKMGFITRAGKRLRVSPSAISHAMRSLEENIGVRLLSRTTRSVTTTDAGNYLLARLRPAVSEIHEAVNQVSGFRDQPAGRVRLLVPRLAAMTVLAPKLGQFAREYPDILLDVTTDDSRMDIVEAGSTPVYISVSTSRKT